ncbi:MAG TPA: hypothetical protein VIK65_05235 [Candidatus Limnocylindrales bacterium]
MSHPSLGLPPVDRTAGLPPAAARVDAAGERLAARALEIAIDRDPTFRDRYDEIGLRRLVRDTVTLIDRVVDAMAVDDPEPARVFAEAVPPAYRRRMVPMDDLITLCEAIRTAIGGVLARGDMAPVDAAVDAMIERFRWHRRLAGDARKRNRILAAIYKGA